MSQPQMAMANMGGPVGGMNANQINAGTPNNSGANIPETNHVKRLNTAIYDYLLRNQLYDIARQFYQKMEVETDTKKSPNQRGQANGLDDSNESDCKEIQNRPDDLPAPMNMGVEGPFLQDWWCQFWEIFQGHRGKGKMATLQYIGQQRNMQKQRVAMIGGGNAADAAVMQQRMNAMSNGMDLKRVALQNPRNLNPQAMAQLKNIQASQQNAMMGGAQMDRQNSQIDMTGGRTGSPNSGDGPSPKRQRIDGNNMPQNNQARPGPPQMQSAQSVENYSHSIQQTMKAAMSKAGNGLNKGMPQNGNMGPVGQQSSPMSQANLEGVTGEFYAANGVGRMNAMANNAMANVAAAANQQNAVNPANGGGNHALQDYQMQLMLLEQQNKKRLLMARQEQDNMAHPGAQMPNGQFAAGMSPSGSRQGDPSPNTNEMQRNPSKMKGGLSPNGDMTGRGSPQPGNMMPPEMRQQMMANGQLIRPPSSHPQMPNGMSPEQMRMIQQQHQQNQMIQNGWQGQPHPGQMMPGQPGPMGGPMGGPNAGPPNMSQRQATQMGPPPAPTVGTGPSSPAPAQAPPTPSQTKGGKNNRKETKAKPKQTKAANAAASAAEADQPPTPTNASATGMNAQNFNAKPNAHMANGQANGAQSMNNMMQPNTNLQPNQAADLNAPFGNVGADAYDNITLDFADLGSQDVLDNFDFDSFLNTDDNGTAFGFDASMAFDGSIEAGGELGGDH